MAPPPIDDSAPWLRPWAPAARAVHAAWQGRPLHEALNGAAGPGAARAVRFVPQGELPAGEPYERHIFRTGTVPTREHLHDFFNGLAWLHFPAAKRRLNGLQAGEIARAGVGAARGPLRDAVTVFDENGAVLQAPDALWQALAARDWQTLFVTRRALWVQARLTLFGHALAEKLAQPRKAITAHVLRLPCGAGGDPRALDTALADALQGPVLAAKPFVPLPVLGVPGWWAGNATPDFYDDPWVFRPERVSGSAGFLHRPSA